MDVTECPDCEADELRRTVDASLAALLLQRAEARHQRERCLHEAAHTVVALLAGAGVWEADTQRAILDMDGTTAAAESATALAGGAAAVAAGLATDLQAACGEVDWADAVGFAESVVDGLPAVRNYVADALEFGWPWVEDLAAKLAAHGSLSAGDLRSWYGDDGEDQ